MKAVPNFSDLMVETIQKLASLRDLETLTRVRAILDEAHITREDLAAYDRSVELCNAGGAIPMDEFLLELETL